MLEILLLILKILGLSILWILGIVLFILFLIIFVPVRYRADVSYEGILAAKAGGSWLLHLISVFLIVQEKDMQIRIRLFGIPIKKIPIGDKKKSSDEEGVPEEEEEVQRVLELSEGFPVRTEHEIAETQKIKEKQQKSAETVKTDSEETVFRDKPKEKEPDKVLKESFEKTVAETSQETKTGSEKDQAAYEKIDIPEMPEDPISMMEDFIEKTGDKLDEVNEKLDDLRDKLDFIREDRVEAAISHVLKKVFRLLGAMLPKKLSGKAAFGFDDPSLTGKIIGFFCAFWPQHPDHLTLEPDFTEKRLEGAVSIKGRIWLIELICIAVSAVLNGNVFYVIRNYKKHFSKKNKEAEANGVKA